MRPSWRDRVVTFRTAGMAPDARQRLWELLLDEAKTRGADGFSIEPDTSFAASAGGPGPEALLAHLRGIRPLWQLSLRPPAWPIDDQARLWLPRLGTQVFRLTLWAGKWWMARTGLWGRSMVAVVPMGAWDAFLERLDTALGELPDHSVQRWRSLEPREAGGWAVPRRWRWAIVFAGIVVGLVLGALVGWDAALGSVGIAGAIAAALPQREPSTMEKLFVRTDSLTDPGFQRIVGRSLTVGVVGVVLLAVAGSSVAVSDPGSPWRIAFVIVLAFAAVLAIAGIAPPALWLWRRRGRPAERGSAR